MTRCQAEEDNEFRILKVDSWWKINENPDVFFGPTLDIICWKKKNIPQKGSDISVVYRANVVEIVLDSTKSCTKYFLLGSFGFSHSGTRGYHKSIQLFNIDIFTPQKSKHRYQTWPYFSRSPPFSKAHMCFCFFFSGYDQPGCTTCWSWSLWVSW